MYYNDVGRRGYADAEIEAVFAKYDADGDSGLNLSEQGRMQRDLEDQKVTTLAFDPRVYLDFLTRRGWSQSSE